MIISLPDGTEVDTERDLSATERHVLQKLLNWRDLSTSLAMFREKKAKALAAGWNQSGPLRPGPKLTRVIALLERQLHERLKDQV